MIEEPAEPRQARGAALVLVEREDLELFGVSELSERIERLEAEAARTRRALDKKQSGKSAADALFQF